MSKKTQTKKVVEAVEQTVGTSDPSFQVKKEDAAGFLEKYKKQNPTNYEVVKADFEKRFGSL